MVFPPCGSSLYDVLKLNSFRGFWLQDVQEMSHHCCEGLRYLHEEMGLTHTDLKPENVLLTSMEPLRIDDFPRARRGSQGSYLRPADCRVKLIDFGNATFRHEHHSSVINTRQYRGPEVLLGTGWGELSDVWSMACVIAELYTGECLYPARTDAEHLTLMERTAQKPMPRRLLESSGANAKSKLLECRGGPWRVKAPSITEKFLQRLQTQRPIREIVEPHHVGFQRLLTSLLELDPEERPSMRVALLHSFWQEQLKD
jgi:serine/threonine protein kinase